MGQLGLGEDVLERKKPAMVTLPEGIVQAVAGGMHTVCLSDTGNVWVLRSQKKKNKIHPTMVYGSGLFFEVMFIFVSTASCCRSTRLAVMMRVLLAGIPQKRALRWCQEKWS